MRQRMAIQVANLAVYLWTVRTLELCKLVLLWLLLWLLLIVLRGIVLMLQLLWYG